MCLKVNLGNIILEMFFAQTYQWNKQVKKMYVMDRYPVKQPQNVIIKVRIKQHGIGGKESWKNVE